VAPPRSCHFDRSEQRQTPPPAPTAAVAPHPNPVISSVASRRLFFAFASRERVGSRREKSLFDCRFVYPSSRFSSSTKYPPHLRVSRHRRKPNLVSSRSYGGEHDSTGLRAKHKLITPRTRCASPRNTLSFSALPRRHSQNRNGERIAPRFHFQPVLKCNPERSEGSQPQPAPQLHPLTLKYVGAQHAAPRVRNITVS
jgi:hypothetical protein